VASTLLANHVLGADLLEVGYILRQGVDVNHHIGLWDVLSRNAVFLTGNGVSDEYHVFRIRKLLERQGVKVYVAPRPDSRPRSVWQRGLAVLREAVSYMAWQLHIPG